MNRQHHEPDAATKRKVYESWLRYSAGWDRAKKTTTKPVLPPQERQKDEEMNVNRVFLAGNLTREVELRFTPSNTAVASFGLASNRRWRDAQGNDKEDVCFVDCTAFGRTAEVINEHFTKGKPIYVEGRLRFESWDDKQGGGKRSKLSVTVENFQFVGGRDADTADGSGREIDRSTSQDAPTGGGGRYPRRHTGRRQQQPEPPFSEGDREFTEDQIPFRWEGRRGQAV